MLPYLWDTMYNSSVAENWTIFSYAQYVVCMYLVSLIHLLLPNQINHYYYKFCATDSSPSLQRAAAISEQSYYKMHT